MHHTLDTAPPESHTLSCDAVRELDRRAQEELHIPGLLLMENAADALLAAAMSMLGPRDNTETDARACLCVCGPGNNGGDGIALARKLHNRGIRAAILLATPEDKVKGDARTNLDIARACGVPIFTISDGDETPGDGVRRAAKAIRGQGHHVARAAPLLVIDALLGTGATPGPLREPIGTFVRAINALRDNGDRTLAVDVPSGLDAQTGKPLEDHPIDPPVIAADVTIALAAKKPGLLAGSARPYVGTLGVGDIGVPHTLTRSLASNAETQDTPEVHDL
jgi:hydroxyethylthiazole kinase-like uncharacterized protein yjeF